MEQEGGTKSRGHKEFREFREFKKFRRDSLNSLIFLLPLKKKMTYE